MPTIRILLPAIVAWPYLLLDGSTSFMYNKRLSGDGRFPHVQTRDVKRGWYTACCRSSDYDLTSSRIWLAISGIPEAGTWSLKESFHSMGWWMYHTSMGSGDVVTRNGEYLGWGYLDWGEAIWCSCHKQEKELLWAVRVLILEQLGGMDSMDPHIGHWQLRSDIRLKL